MTLIRLPLIRLWWSLDRIQWCVIRYNLNFGSDDGTFLLMLSEIQKILDPNTLFITTKTFKDLITAWKTWLGWKKAYASARHLKERIKQFGAFVSQATLPKLKKSIKILVLIASYQRGKFFPVFCNDTNLKANLFLKSTLNS